MKCALLMVFIVACASPPGSPGSDGTAGRDGADGANGPNGADGINGTDGDDGADGTDGLAGQVGASGPIDARAPPAVSRVHLVASPLLPPSHRLSWSIETDGPALSAVKIYQSALPFDDTNKAEVAYDTAPGAATHATVQVHSESGLVYFGVAPVSFTGVEAPLAFFVLDTRERTCWDGVAAAVNTTVCFWADGDATFASEDRAQLSPDNRSLLLLSSDLGTLATIDLEDAGAQKEPLVAQTVPIVSPAYAPAGTEVAFLSSAAKSNECDTDLWVAPLGATPRRLTGAATANGETDCIISDGAVSSFAWSPEGTTLSFHAFDAANDRSALRTVDIDGGTSIDWMTVDPTHLVPGGIVASRFSPDGRYIAFTTDTRALWVAVLATQTLIPIVTQTTNALMFVWSPDSRRIAVIRETSPMSQKPLTVHTLTGATLAIGEASTNELLPPQPLAWSPDGHWLSVIATDIVYVFSSTTAQKRFESLGGAHYGGEARGQERAFGWSPNGRYFGFLVVDNLDSEDGVHIVDTTNGSQLIFERSNTLLFSWSASGTSFNVATTTGTMARTLIGNGAESAPPATFTSVRASTRTTFAP